MKKDLVVIRAVLYLRQNHMHRYLGKQSNRGWLSSPACILKPPIHLRRHARIYGRQDIGSGNNFDGWVCDHLMSMHVTNTFGKNC